MIHPFHLSGNRIGHPDRLPIVTTPPLRKDAARNRAQLVGVARALVDEGIPLQLNDIARRAGVGVATAYRHFPTAEALLEAVATPCLQAIVDYGEQALTAADPAAAFSQFLSRVIEAQVSDMSLSPVNAALVDQLPHTTELKTRLRTAGSQLLSRAQESGAVRADLTEYDLVPLMCGIAYAATAHPGAPPAEVAQRYLEMLLSGLQVRTPEQHHP